MLPVDSGVFTNDNLLFPYLFLPGTYVADRNGFAFSAVVDGTLEDFDAFGAGPPYGQQVDEVTPGSNLPTEFAYTYTVTPGAAGVGTGTAVTPEPSSFLLLGTGVLGLGLLGVTRKRFV